MSTAHHLTVVRCTYKIENFIEFEDRLDNSLARDVIKLEHVRMRMTFEPIMVGDLVDMEARRPRLAQNLDHTARLQKLQRRHHIRLPIRACPSTHMHTHKQLRHSRRSPSR